MQGNADWEASAAIVASQFGLSLHRTINVKDGKEGYSLLHDKLNAAVVPPGCGPHVIEAAFHLLTYSDERHRGPATPFEREPGEGK